MFDKPKPTKQELRKLANGIATAGTLGDLIGALERAIETAVKPISFVDDAARKELARTQLSLGVSGVYLRRLISASEAYLAELKAKPAGKVTAKKTAPKSKAASKAKPKAGGKTKTAAKKAVKAGKR